MTRTFDRGEFTDHPPPGVCAAGPCKSEEGQEAANPKPGTMSAGGREGGSGGRRTHSRNQGGTPAWEDGGGFSDREEEDERVSYWLQDAMAASATVGSIVLDTARDTVMLVRSLLPPAIVRRRIKADDGLLFSAATEATRRATRETRGRRERGETKARVGDRGRRR
jgi:hypothetical protein